MTSETGEVTRLLQAMNEGDERASGALLPIVYKELHRIAESCMRRERPDHTLQPTALINEAWLRLSDEKVDWKDRAHFIGIAAHVMRRVLVDYARQHGRKRRAGDLQRVELDDNMAISPDRLHEVLVLDQAMERLAAKSPRQARVVELRYFGGLSVEQIAGMLEVAPRSVKRDWALARVFLFRELNPGKSLSSESEAEPEA
jgi:RNA polymerase sigma factor (TIGR02999 family)